MQAEQLVDRWWGRAIAGGVIGGSAMALYMMVVMASRGLGFWTFLNIIGATVPAFRSPTAGFGPLATPTGLGLHLAAAAGWALAYSLVAWAIAPRMVTRYAPAIATGLLYGSLMYILMGRLIGPLTDPAVNLLPQGHYLIAHLIYGVIMAAIVAVGARHEEAAITFAPSTSVEEPLTPWRP